MLVQLVVQDHLPLVIKQLLVVLTLLLSIMELLHHQMEHLHLDMGLKLVDIVYSNVNQGRRSLVIGQYNSSGSSATSQTSFSAGAPVLLLVMVQQIMLKVMLSKYYIMVILR